MATDDTEAPPVTTGNSPLPSLDPPLAPFAASSLEQDPVLQSSRSSFTRIDHDDDQRREPSHDPIISSTSFPVPYDTTNTQADESEHSPPLAPLLPQDQELKQTQFDPTTMEEPVPQTPQTHLTFLLISGKRRTMSFEPDTAIGRMKELAWNSWPADWQDERPPAPSYLRVLYLGRMLQDDETLTNLKLPTHTPLSECSTAGPPSTVMHLSIRPFAPPTDDDAIKKKRRRGQDDGSMSNGAGNPLDEAGCCRCIIC
ncbi:hypothetical protein M413DRAFT_444873 [Hebeloma cylindrosporum]|uniref:Ubiquitin-like domain-containing protein n=1 Tax=Hebeloma cylindrosporum TaxID=76867 RepID=A0A0C2YN51_HEBCY|nr:hypothetical protein M413DRAFT_444873 [Hebeloma cylindrosporum h7]